MKYILNDSGKEVKIGDTIAVSTTVNTIFGPATATAHVVITQDNIKKLVENGVVIKREDKILSRAICYKIIAEKLQISEDEVVNILGEMFGLGVYTPGLQLLLKAASDYLSPDIATLKSLPKVYTISLVDGRVHEIQTTDIKTYDHFAYFVSKTQAKHVRTMFKDVFIMMYGE